MRKSPVTTKALAAQVVKDIRRAPRKLYSSEEKIRIVLTSPRGGDSIAELCRKEGIAQSVLQLVEGTTRGRQEAAGWRHRPSGQYWRGEGRSCRLRPRR